MSRLTASVSRPRAPGCAIVEQDRQPPVDDRQAAQQRLAANSAAMIRGEVHQRCGKRVVLSRRSFVCLG